MNPSFPDWNNIGTESPVLTQNHKNKTFGLDGELVELLWENGQVVLHAQNHHHNNSKPGGFEDDDSRQVAQKQVYNQSGIRGNLFSCENPVTDLIQGTETVSWIDDPFEKEFSSNFFSEFPHSTLPIDEPVGAGKSVDHRCSNFAPNQSLPPRFDTFDHSHMKGISKNGTTSVPDKPARQPAAEYHQSPNKGCGIRIRGEVGEHSAKTVASSHCGSNQVMNDAADVSPVSSSGIGDRGLSAAMAKHNVGKMSSQSDRIQTETLGTVITSSSSGGSQSSFGRESNHSRGTTSHKRKSRDIAEDSECQSKDAEFESAPRKKSGLKSRKSRAAEVHNLSERRRRDRINEKMRILQELLPHSNKTDKASMLDEAIEYMKSLQQQVQIMWMGSGMAPFMFPGVQHCMSRLAMGMGPLQLPHNPMHFPRMPLQQVDQAAAAMQNQAAICQANMLSKINNYQSQLQNAHIPQQFANYMQFHPLQGASQMNVFSFGPKTATNDQMSAPPGSH